MLDVRQDLSLPVPFSTIGSHLVDALLARGLGDQVLAILEPDKEGELRRLLMPPGR